MLSDIDFFPNDRDITLKSKVDKLKLAQILKGHADGLLSDKDINSTHKSINGDGQVTLFKELYDSIEDDGCFTSSYTQRGCSKRYQSCMPLSLQNMHRPIRHTIAGEFYYDLDMKNCHPVLLRQLCIEKGYPYEGLSYYIDNREECLSSLSVFNWDRNYGKKQTLAILNGKKDFGKDGFKEELMPNWFVDYYNNVQDIIICVKKDYPTLYQKAYESKEKRAIQQKRKEVYNPEGTMMSSIMSDMENRALMYTYDFVSSQGIEIGCLCYDGLMIYKDGLDDEDVEELLRACEDNLKEKMNVEVDFVHKHMDEGIPEDSPILNQEVTVEPKRNNINKNSVWYNTEYVSYSKKKFFDSGYTYGHIVEKDLSFAKFTIKQRTPVHGVRFADILGINYTSFPSIDADETIEQNNIGSLDRFFDKANLVFIRSNMMTYKTVNTVDYLKNNPELSALHISFRITLAQKHYNDLKECDFKLYSSEDKGSIKNVHRLVVQLDSLTRVRGKYDLIILDEVELTREHMFAHTMNDRRLACWDSLSQFIKSSSKVMVSDALLLDETVEWVRNLGGKTRADCHVVENTYQSFKDDEMITLDAVDSNKMALMVIEKLKAGEKIGFPCNNKKYLERVAFLLTDQTDYKIGIATQDNRIDIETWGEYDFIGYSPTYVAGNSFNDKHFTRLMGFFQNDTCTAQAASQMIRRIRNTEKPSIFSFGFKAVGYLPTNKSGVARYLRERDDIVMKMGFKIDRVEDDIVRDLYYNEVVHNIIRKNISKLSFKDLFCDIARLHGAKIKYSLVEESDEVEVDILESYGMKCEVKRLEDKDADITSVLESDDLDYTSAMAIKDKTILTLKERYALRKFDIKDCYHLQEVNKDIIEKFENKQSSFRRLELMKSDGWVDWVIPEIRAVEFDTVENNFNRLHKSNNHAKSYGVHLLLSALGFDGVNDMSTLEHFPYEKSIDILNKRGEDLDILFDKQRVKKVEKWNEEFINNPKYMKQISMKINGYLQYAGIGIKSLSRGRDKTVGISPWKWEDYGIKFSLRSDLAVKKLLHNNKGAGFIRRMEERKSELGVEILPLDEWKILMGGIKV